MEAKRNLCAMIPETLHAEVRREQEQLGQTLSAYIEQILTEHFTKQKGGGSMEGTKTLAVQISTELYNELKEYLAKHRMTQKQFILDLIRQALDQEAQDKQTGTNRTE